MPTPYMQDLFAAMRADGQIAPRVFYMEMAPPGTYWGDRDLPDGEDLLPGKGMTLLGGRIHWNGRITSALREDAPDIFVITGYSSVTSQLAIRRLRQQNKPWIFFGERPGVRDRRGPGRLVRSVAMKTALRSACAISAVGSLAAEAYLERCGNRKPIYNIPYYTDTSLFQDCPAQPGSQGGRLRILYCGQLIERKGVDLLLRSFLRAIRIFPEMTLDLVGEGPLRPRLEASVPNDMREKITFHGFSAVEDLPNHFSRADLFVLPSRHDGWGVVVNQALAAGLPVIASDAVGAAQDYVANQGAGAIIPAGDENALAAALESFAANPAEIRVCANFAKTVAKELTLERGIERWLSMFRQTLDDNTT